MCTIQSAQDSALSMLRDYGMMVMQLHALSTHHDPSKPACKGQVEVHRGRTVFAVLSTAPGANSKTAIDATRHRMTHLAGH